MAISVQRWVVLMVLGLMVPPALAFGQDAPRFFEENCAMCHAIGGPPQDSAPDLKDVTRKRDRAWLRQFIADPEGMSKRDPNTAALVKQYGDVVMPQVDGLTAAMVDALLDYLEARSRGTAAPSSALAPADQIQAVPSAADVDAGRALFFGANRLAGRGPACVACHDVGTGAPVGGGRLGPDLTHAASRLGGARGLGTWLSAPPTRVMRGVFRMAAPETSEAKAIAAFLADVDSRPSSGGRPVLGRSTVFATSIAGGLLLFGMIAVAGRRRVRSVRASLPVQPAGDSL